MFCANSTTQTARTIADEASKEYSIKPKATQQSAIKNTPTFLSLFATPSTGDILSPSLAHEQSLHPFASSQLSLQLTRTKRVWPMQPLQPAVATPLHFQVREKPLQGRPGISGHHLQNPVQSWTTTNRLTASKGKGDRCHASNQVGTSYRKHASDFSSVFIYKANPKFLSCFWVIHDGNLEIKQFYSLCMMYKSI